MKTFKLRRTAAIIGYTVLAVVLFSSCQKEIYSKEECKNFKHGDTIYVKEFYMIKRCVVLNNDPKLELIEMRDIRFSWDTRILEYDSFRFK